MKLNWVQRYKDGDCINVWKEINNGQHLIKFGDYRNEINDVIEETIKITKFNSIILYEKLLHYNYPFRAEFPLYFLKPNRFKSTDRLNEEFNEIGLSVPLLLNKFYQEIGGIDFRRKLNEEEEKLETLENENLQTNVIDKYYTDPFHIYSLEDIYDVGYLKRIIEEYENKWSYFPKIDICPDFYFKENVSGGGSYEALIQGNKMVNPIMDMCELDLENFSFLDYLRINFRNGGFMGLEFYEDLSTSALNFREHLTTGLKSL